MAGLLASDRLWASRSKVDLLLIASLCLGLYFAGNGRISLWDRDEAWYAQTAREMLQRGDYVVPTFNGEPRFRKPVLIYWLIAGAYSVFGENEFAARFWSTIGGTLTCLLTYRLGARMEGREAGLVAALMLAVSPLMVVESKLATTDAMLTAILVAAMSLVWELHVSGASWRRSLAFWALVGIAILTKGPVGPAFIASAVTAWLLLIRRWDVLGRFHAWAGLLVVLAITLPWGLAVHFATQGEFYRVALGEQAIGHSLGTMNHHGGFPGYYLIVAIAGLFPWTLALSLALGGVRRWARADVPASFLLAWIVGPLFMLELMRTKLPHYYLPACPAWALLLGRGIVAFHSTGRRLVSSRLGLTRVLALGIAGVLTMLVLVLVVPFVGLVQPGLAAMTAGGSLAIGTMGAAWLFLARRDGLAWSVLVATWALTFTMTSAWLLPRAEPCRLARAAAKALKVHAEHGSIALFGFREPSLVFYLGKPVPAFGSTREFSEFVNANGRVYTLLRETDVAKLSKQPDLMLELFERVQSEPLGPFEPRAVSVFQVSWAGALRDHATHTPVFTEDYRE